MAERRDRGFALLIVLWWTVLLAVLGNQLAASGRLESRRASNVRDAAVAEAAAEGALQEAAFHLIASGDDHWGTDPTIHTLPVPGGSAMIVVSDEAAKIGLNQATAGLLAALMSQLGEDRQQAASLAGRVLEWRVSAGSGLPGAKAAAYAQSGLSYAPPEADFETIGELGLVLGMNPALLRRLAPYLSIYQTGDPDFNQAGPVVRAAWAQSGDIGATETGRFGLQSEAGPIVTVTVQVAMASGARAAHRSVILLAAGEQNRAFRILAQDE